MCDVIVSSSLPASDLTGFGPVARRLVLLAGVHLNHGPLLEATAAAFLSSPGNSATGELDCR